MVGVLACACLIVTSAIPAANQPVPDEPTARSVHMPDGTDLVLIRVQPATFNMGRDLRIAERVLSGALQEGIRDGRPRRPTTITRPYYLGSTKVTVGIYVRFLNSSERADRYICLGPWSGIERAEGRFRAVVPDDWPVATATWEGATAFCAWLSAQTGKRFRLPTEAEWELAARGIEGREFPWGDEFKAGVIYTQPRERAEPGVEAVPSAGPLAPVGSYPANATPTGILDMFDTVGEWCSDRYAPQYDPNDARDPQGPAEGEARVLRGRGRCMERERGDPEAAAGRIYGFRVLMEVSLR